MDLRSHYPYWLFRDGLINTYPSIHQNLKTDVAIIGAGITGALMAWYLGKTGRSVTVVDKRHVGMGSTSATTGLLQYELDTPLWKLIKVVGERNALKSYELCLNAIYSINEIRKQLSENSDFHLQPSFQFASATADVKNLKRECELRVKHNISQLEWLDSAEIERRYGFYAPAGLLSKDGARIDAYKFTHHLLKYCTRNWHVAVYDSTEVTEINHLKNTVELSTSFEKKITANHLIICAGYESDTYLRKPVERKFSTYAIVSEPIDCKEFWFENSLIWETATPYLYMCTTTDHRILVGGRDDPFYNPNRRDKRLPDKAKGLQEDFIKKFPHIPFRTDFQWAGTFCSTKDGLPYIGSIKQRPRTYFALGYGGNGITFGQIAAEIIADVINGKPNANSELYCFDR
jgi:glycine/D-amino acid oxidase-like deaminating enzyme